MLRASVCVHGCGSVGAWQSRFRGQCAHSYQLGGRLRAFWNVPNKASVSEGSIVRWRLWTWRFDTDFSPPPVGVFVRYKSAHTTGPLFVRPLTRSALSVVCSSICDIWFLSSRWRRRLYGFIFRSRACKPSGLSQPSFEKPLTNKSSDLFSASDTLSHVSHV